jgi:hypothetical protein
MGRSQRHRCEEQVRSSSGAIYEEGGINDQALKAIGGAIANATPVLTSLNPATAVHGAADVTMHCLGSNFTTGSVININGAPAATTFVNSGDITAVMPVLSAPAAALIPVVVINGGVLSSLTKTFTLT